MDDKPIEAGPDYPKVTFDDAVEFLTEKHTRRECEICGNTGWAIGITEEPTVPGFTLQSTMTFLPVSNLPLVLIECTNCGNVKSFSERFILTYLKAKRAAVQQNGEADARPVV